MLYRLTIRGVLVALGSVAVLVACALAGFGLLAASLQVDARQRVAVVEQAVQNHAAADALLDDVRADVQRNLLAAFGVSMQTKGDTASELRTHFAELHDRISQNALAPLPTSLHQNYVDLQRRMDAFAAGVDHVVNLTSDALIGARAYDDFRAKFADADVLMDTSRDELTEHAVHVRDAAAAVFQHVRWMIIGSLGIGVALLLSITWGAIILASRITGALASSRQEAHHLALHDPLTGLPNRAFLADRLTKSLAETDRNGKLLALLCLDLDEFKQVNDTLGHPIGDELLRAVADRLRSCVRKSDTIARLGGDEFVIVQTPIARAEEAGQLAQRMIDLLSEPYEIQLHQVIISASVGVALAPTDATDPHILLKMADMALYRAKADGRRIFRFFEPEMDAKLQARRLMELDLRRAVNVGEFELHYQPLMNLPSRCVTGVEALVRWRHPERGLIPPSDFIPLAEDVGLIRALGGWVLRQACHDAAQWPDHILVAVNVAAAQFKSEGLVAAVEKALADSGLAPHRLELEITETALLESTDTVLAILNDLRARGVRIAMDDFGTGYSSLGYLLSFPFDKIKIDGRFIRDLENRPESRAIVRAVIGLSQDLGMTTVVEGVETKEQLSRLINKGCEQVQGYLLSRPVPVGEITQFFGAANVVRGPDNVRV